MDDKQTPSSAHLSHMANAVITTIEKKEAPNAEPKIVVNRFVSELATWYEKLRNAMDINDDEVILRSAIERILGRRLLLGGNPRKIAEPLLRELVWARYFQNNTLPESMVEKVSEIIDVHMKLRKMVLDQGILKEKTVNEWIKQLTSSQIARSLSPNIEKNTLSNFMYHIMRDRLSILDDNDDTKNVQEYIAVRRAFARDDIAFLRYYLFNQIFGEITSSNLQKVADHFVKAYQEVEYQLHYKLKEKIFIFVKRQTPVFFILEDVMKSHKENLRQLIANGEEFTKAVFTACDIRYKGIASKVRRAIIRSVVFLIVTKAIIALGVEGSYENWRYGHIAWETIGINTGIPPLLMIVVSLFIKTPDKENSKRILTKIQSVLFDETPNITPPLKLSLVPPKGNTIIKTVFGLLWFAAFFISFGFMVYVLNKLHFDIVSQGIFLFFIAIVSFLAYRINSTAHMYTIDDKQSLLTPFIDFLFIPVVRVGMLLTDGISQINIIIFLFDFLIEAPFKAVFAFFEQWFLYMHTKREDLE
ncbi:MAG: hypothetical protein ACREGI_04080 [Candidatus Levyibacteriota bacterium]